MAVSYTHLASYQTLREALEYLEISSLVLMTVMMGIGILMLFGITKGMIEPLTNLAETANLVGQGNFNVKMPPTDSLDEVGIVTRAFNTMVESLEEYIIRTTRSMEKEQMCIRDSFCAVLKRQGRSVILKHRDFGKMWKSRFPQMNICGKR